MDLTIPIEDLSRRGALYGTADRNLRLIRAAFDVRITARDNVVRISGETEAVRKAAHVVEDIQRLLRARPDVSDSVVQESIERASRDGVAAGGSPIEVVLNVTRIKPRSGGQKR